GGGGGGRGVGGGGPPGRVMRAGRDQGGGAGGGGVTPRLDRPACPDADDPSRRVTRAHHEDEHDERQRTCHASLLSAVGSRLSPSQRRSRSKFDDPAPGPQGTTRV